MKCLMRKAQASRRRDHRRASHLAEGLLLFNLSSTHPSFLTSRSMSHGRPIGRTLRTLLDGQSRPATRNLHSSGRCARATQRHTFCHSGHRSRSRLYSVRDPSSSSQAWRAYSRNHSPGICQPRHATSSKTPQWSRGCRCSCRRHAANRVLLLRVLPRPRFPLLDRL